MAFEGDLIAVEDDLSDFAQIEIAVHGGHIASNRHGIGLGGQRTKHNIVVEGDASGLDIE